MNTDNLDIENIIEDIAEDTQGGGNAAASIDKTGNTGPVEVYAEYAEAAPAELEGADMHAIALAYARYLAEHELKPGDATSAETEEVLGGEQEKSPEEKEAAEDQGGRSGIYSRVFVTPAVSDAEAEAVSRSFQKSAKSLKRVGAVIDLYDRLQDGVANTAVGLGVDFVKASHRIASTYRQSKRTIGIAILLIGIMAALVLAIFDRYTVYEYAYNGKILGYVQNQDDVMDVLEVAGTKLTENSTGGAEITFTPNQNITFNVMDGRGKSIDSADAVVNKLIYMSDIEAEAYGVFDGDNMVALVKSQADAENLLGEAKSILSTPDEGMTLVSSEFTNDLAIKPVNVLLKSIQSNSEARTLMTEGGEKEIYHIVEEDESLARLALTFGVDPSSIFDENNKEVALQAEQGDKVCIHLTVSPVEVKMVERGKMKEIIEFETIKKESEDYYKGDTHIEQEGVDGVQIFSGTITKVAGEVTKRDTDDIEIITEKKDKIILVGTAERPKTAPTGTYIVPLRSYEGISSPFGYRWGRLHSGIDMGAHHGTPIYATDGGTVIMAGWYYGYGLCVDIDHGNGRVTRYGHCSQLLVNKGDQVYQGQNIALVGSTGHSFGNHLHFEIRLNGTPVNPRPYLGI